MITKLEKASRILANNSAASLILVSDKGTEGYDFRKITLSQKLANMFKGYINDYLTVLIKDLNDGSKQLKDYCPGYKPDCYEMEYLNLSSQENGILVEKIHDIPSVTNIPLFNVEDNKFIKRLSFYLVLIQNRQGESFYVFRKYNSKKELTRSKQFIMIYNDGVFDTFEDKIFLFDEKIDCIRIDDFMFIENTYYFQTIFKYYEGLKEKSVKILTDIEEMVPIQNYQDFQDCCTGQLQMLAKLNNISSKPYFNAISMEKIKKTIAAYKLNVKIVWEDGEEKLLFDKNDRWGLLKLLDDDYLGSIMTDTQYVVNSKRAI